MGIGMGSAFLSYAFGMRFTPRHSATPNFKRDKSLPKFTIQIDQMYVDIPVPWMAMGLKNMPYMPVFLPILLPNCRLKNPPESW